MTYNTFLEILKKSHSPMTVESICELAVKEEDQIASYLGYIWTQSHNRKLRRVVESLLNLPNVIRTQEKPMVLQFLCDGCDMCDVYDSKKENNFNKNNSITRDILETETKTDIETPSYRSYRSYSIEGKGVS
jgi:hypothetical protein